MCAGLVSVLLSAPFVLLSLEVISGDGWLPRFWWLGIKQEPVCFIRTEDPARYILPAEAEQKSALEQDFQICIKSDTAEQDAHYQTFVNKRLLQDVDRTNAREVERAFCSDRYWTAYDRTERQHPRTPWSKALWRLAGC